MVEERPYTPTSEDANDRNGFLKDISSARLRRYKTYPCDYVSGLGSLSLNDSNSVKNSNFESDFASLPSFDNDDRKSSIDTISLYSVSTCDVSDDDDNDDDLYSQVTYLSSIHRPVKRRKFTNYSDVNSEYSDGVLLEYWDAEPGPNSEEKLSSDSIRVTNANYGTKFRKLVKLILCIFLFFILISTVLLFLMSACVSQNKQVIPLENLKGNLSSCLIGHDLSVPVIVDAIYKFNTHYLEKKIYFIWIVGPVGVGKSYAKQLIRNSLGSSVVSYSVLSSLLPQDMMSMEKVIDNLIQSLDVCKPNVVFVDGFDEGNDVTFSFLESLFQHLNVQKGVQSSSVQLKVLVFTFGTFGSSKINRYYLQHLKESSEERQSLNFDVLQKEMYGESPFRDMSKISLHFTVVPFLPLEVGHLRECVIRQLNYISKNITCNSFADDSLEIFLKENNFTLEDIQKEVFKLSSIHNKSKVLHIGCKRVYQLVSSLLFQFPNK